MDVDQYFLRDHQLKESDPEDEDLRKGPWTADEDSILMDYVNAHGEGRWNSLAAHAGLKRSGKSCRLRWLNYLRPNVRRGNITLQEQLLILQLHSRWGNRWSKIAEYLPGRTDNEIKNYWRTRVQKQAKQLNCDVNSQQFQDAMRYVWIPRLMERVGASSSESLTSGQPTATACAPPPEYCQLAADSSSDQYLAEPNLTPETSGTSSNSSGHQDFSNYAANPTSSSQLSELEYYPTSGSSSYQYGPDSTAMGSSDNWLTPGGDPMENLWNEENICFLQQQLNSDE